MISKDTTIREEFVALEARLNASRSARNLMLAFPRTMRISVGEVAPFFVRFHDGSMQVRSNADAEVDIVLQIGEGMRFRDVLRGILDITHTLASGELTVKAGKVSDLILFNRIIVAGQKK